MTKKTARISTKYNLRIPVKESSPRSSYTIVYSGVNTSSRCPRGAELVPTQLSRTTALTPTVYTIAGVCFPWFPRISKNNVSVGWSALLVKLSALLQCHQYIEVLQTISSNGDRYVYEQLSLIYFVVAFCFYNLKLYPQARRYLSVCKSIADTAKDFEYLFFCTFFLAKTASKVHSHRKAAKHYRKAAVFHKQAFTTASKGTSPFAELLGLEPCTLSFLHYCSSVSFQKVGRLYQALHESIEAVKCAENDEDRLLAYCACGELYQLVNNHTSALEWCEKVIECACIVKDTDLIRKAHANSCSSCIALGLTEKALFFFRKALPIAGGVANGEMEWICKTIHHLPMHRATLCIPRSIVLLLLETPKLTDTFRVELEWSLRRLPIQEEGFLNSKVIDDVDMFTRNKPSSESVIPFYTLVEKPPPSSLCGEFSISDVIKHIHGLLVDQPGMETRRSFSDLCIQHFPGFVHVDERNLVSIK